MNVLLINPWQAEIFPPPSIGYLQAALKHWKINVTAMDYNDAMTTQRHFDIVGVTFHSFSVRNARAIRDKFPDSKLICGGHHPSAMPEQMLAIGYDQVVVGEGENAIIDIIQGNKNRIIVSDDCEHKYFNGINDMPFPDFMGLGYSGEMGLPVISSRGCPYECNFCASTKFWRRTWTMRSPENVLTEIDRIVSAGVKTWMFEDDNFTLHVGRAVEICKRIKELGSYQWQCASRAESLIDESFVKELASAGCKRIWLGIESLSQQSLDRCNKKTTVEKMIAGIKMARKYAIEPVCQFIAGLPGDTIANISETVLTMRKHHIHGGANILWVLPNTEAHKRAKQRGWQDENYLNGNSIYYTYEQDINTLMNWANLINSA